MLLKNVHRPRINFGIVQYITGKKYKVICCIEVAGADFINTTKF